MCRTARTVGDPHALTWIDDVHGAETVRQLRVHRQELLVCTVRSKFPPGDRKNRFPGPNKVGRSPPAARLAQQFHGSRRQTKDEARLKARVFNCLYDRPVKRMAPLGLLCLSLGRLDRLLHTFSENGGRILSQAVAFASSSARLFEL